jgi:PEP-CTERM motif
VKPKDAAGLEKAGGAPALWRKIAMNARIGVSVASMVGAVLAAASLLSGAQAAETIPGAIGEASANGYLTSPSTFDRSDTAATSIYGVPLSTYGEMGSYTVTTIITGEPVTMTEPNTPGVVGSEGVSAADITMNRTYPSLNVVGDYGCCSGGLASGNLDYYFEVVNSTAPGSVSPVTVGVTASGGVSGSATANTADPNDYGVSVLAQAQLLITAGPGSSVVDELAQTNAGYQCVSGACAGDLNSTTSNVTVDFGATTTFSGGFSLKDEPITIDTDTVYEVELYAAVGGDPIIDERAYIDPMITMPAGYSLELSAGILNGTQPIPEPSTWAMMLAGFAGLGFLGLTRARKAGLAA